MRPFLLLSFLVFSLGIIACSGSEPPPAPPPEPTATEPLSIPTPDSGEATRATARTLGQALGTAYQGARSRVAKVGGAARYWGDYLPDSFEVFVSVSEETAGFDDFQYKPNCDAKQPSAICAMAHAFPPGEVQAVGEMAQRLGLVSGIEYRVVGKADSVWKASKKPRLYGGECGEAECHTDDGLLSLRRAMKIDSNQVLACLRALCTQAQSGLGNPLVAVKLHGKVTTAGSTSADRRAEISLFLQLKQDMKNFVWDAFKRQVGHL